VNWWKLRPCPCGACLRRSLFALNPCAGLFFSHPKSRPLGGTSTPQIPPALGGYLGGIRRVEYLSSSEQSRGSLSPLEKRLGALTVRGSRARLGGRGPFLMSVLALGAACNSASRQPALSKPNAAPTSSVHAEPTQEPLSEALEPESIAEESDFIDAEPQGDAGFAHGDRFGEYVCGSTRPQLCDATPSPVCARLGSEATPESPTRERTTTYVNGCLACADPSVFGYLRGRCRVH
jgi:hypothetical protein